MSSYNCQACSKPMVEWVEVCVDCASKLEESAPYASANTGSPKLPLVKNEEFGFYYDPAVFKVTEKFVAEMARQLRASA